MVRELISLTFLDSAKTAITGVSDTTCAKALYSIDLEVYVGLDQDRKTDATFSSTKIESY